MITRRTLGTSRLALLAVLATAPALLPAQQPAQQAVRRPTVPESRRDSVVDSLHGVAIADPYRWLEEQDAPGTRAWIDRQNAYTDSVLGAIPGRERIERRLTELFRVDQVSVPFATGGRYFFSKRAADQDLSVLYVRRGRDGKDGVLVDPHSMSPDHTVSVNFMNVTPDGKLVAYAVRRGGEDEVSVRLLDVDSHQLLPDSLPRARYSGMSITPDRKHVYYSRLLRDGPRVFRHTIGADPTADVKIFGDGYGPEKIIGAGVTDDGRWLRISVSHGSAAKKTEIYVKDLARDGPIVPVVNDIEATFGGPIVGDRLFMVTNWNAPNNRVLAVDLRNPARAAWKEIVPEGKSPIAGVSPVGGRLFVDRIENVQTRVTIHDTTGRQTGELELPGIGAVGGVSGRWENPEAFFAFSSLAQPTTIYRYDVPTGRREVWAKLNVPVSRDNVEIKQVWYTSKDGTRVPMFVAHRTGLALDGSNATLLTGYGGFRSSQIPGFSQRAAFWIENGGVFALPNLRGGGEFGEAWHQAGMLDKKQNVFDDFIAAAEWLVANRYTSPPKLAISGGSNGGLLVGAAITQRPDLFRAAVITYPLLDMVRYHKFLVAGYWVPEYGSADSPEQFRYIHGYSPYHRVKPGTRYPAVLLVTGDADTRVAPLHARKMTALLQASTGSDPAERPVILRYHTKAGHSGGLPVRQTVQNMADEMQFLFWQLGVGGARTAMR
ncbi:MAG: prolyl oligopeptidase family protein [Gemmatimonadaceae bacterium]